MASKIRKLENPIYFPAFKALPLFHNGDFIRDKKFSDYFTKTEYPSSVRPNKHWVILADVIEVLMKKNPEFDKNTALLLILCRDQDGHRFHVHIDRGISPIDKYEMEFLEEHSTLPCSIGILYPKQEFLDYWISKDTVTVGIQVKDPTSFIVFPHNREAVVAEVQRIYDLRNLNKFCCMCEAEGEFCSCPMCEYMPEQSGINSIQCECKAVSYCSEECKKNHWENEHIHLCNRSRLMKDMAEFDFSNYEVPQCWDNFGGTSHDSCDSSCDGKRNGHF